MEVVVASHPSAIDHDPGPWHPERPERVAAVEEGIVASELSVHRITSPLASETDLALVHDPLYVGMIENLCRHGGGALDLDTIASPGSWEAALTAAGGVLAAIEELESAHDATALVVARPPGHHALRSRAMGFCLFNNVAVGAAMLRERGERVAILDWDVHHGNGTQEMFVEDPGVLYLSIHQDPFYPFEGQVDDIEFGVPGLTVNIPVPAGTAGDAYRTAWEQLVLPVIGAFEPGWVLVSAGFDAHVDDELAGVRLVAADFGWMAARLAEIHPPDRVVFALEGGYDLQGIRDSTAAMLTGMAGIPSAGTGLVSPSNSYDALEKARAAIRRHWPVAGA